MVEADHIPPKSSLWELRNILIHDVEKRESLKKMNKPFFDLVMNNKDNNEMAQNNNDNNKAYKNYGRQLISMNALHWDHRRALTTGNSHESKACRFRLNTNMNICPATKLVGQI